MNDLIQIRNLHVGFASQGGSIDAVKGINFNYKFHSNKKLSYGIFSSYQQLIETFYYENGNAISKKKSHYYIF